MKKEIKKNQIVVYRAVFNELSEEDFKTLKRLLHDSTHSKYTISDDTKRI